MSRPRNPIRPVQSLKQDILCGRRPRLGACLISHPQRLKPFPLPQPRQRCPPDILTVSRPQDVQRITDAVAVARRNASVVLVSIHAHESHRNREVPAPFLQPFARACIDAGADAFFGAGPHLLRGIEMYKGKPICYSLGNFFFQYETVKQIPAEVYEANNLEITTLDPSLSYDKFRFPQDPVYWESVVPLITYQDGRVVELKLYPVVLGQKAPRFERGTPVLAAPEEGQQIMMRLAKLCEPYGTALRVEPDGVGVIRVAEPSQQPVAGVLRNEE